MVRKVIISDVVQEKVSELESFLRYELKFSKEAARKRSDKMKDFVISLGGIANYPLCRYKRWRKLGYHCAVFEKDWVFAYEVFDKGIIIQDMKHASTLISIE